MYTTIKELIEELSKAKDQNKPVRIRRYVGDKRHNVQRVDHSAAHELVIVIDVVE